MKPNSTTLHWTCAAATSKQTKMYGNGQTAGGIAVSRGGSGAMLFGPGNSQPHKVQACVNGKFHLVDVHAVKSYSTASCALESATSPTVTVLGSTTPLTVVTLATSTNLSTSPTVTTAATTTAATNNTTAATTASANTTNNTTAANNTTSAPKTTNASGGVKGETIASTTPKTPKSGSAGTSGQGGVLGTSTQLPFTGLQLWIVALAGLFALGTGLMLRRVGRNHAH